MANTFLSSLSAWCRGQFKSVRTKFLAQPLQKAVLHLLTMPRKKNFAQLGNKTQAANHSAIKPEALLYMVFFLLLADRALAMAARAAVPGYQACEGKT